MVYVCGSNPNAETTPTNVSPVGLWVLFQSVGASELAVRNESELPISVVKVDLTVITERVKS